MPKIQMTEKWIRSAKTRLAREDFWDTLTSGFGVRVTLQGKKSFFCRYRAGQYQRRMMLGEFPAIGLADARKKFRQIQRQRDEGTDPQVIKQQARIAETVGELFEVFFSDRERKISAGVLARYKGIYRREFKRPLGLLKAKDIRKAHVIPLLRALGERAPTQCERAEELLQACFNYAVSLDLLEFNPLHKLPSFGKTRIGERHLSPEEVGIYLRYIEHLPIIEATYFFLLLFYGARPGELLQWRWEWFQKKRVSIPSEYQKNGRSLVLPLTTHAFNLLKKLYRHTGKSLWLFPNSDQTASRSGFRKTQLLLQEQIKGKSWTLRDIRRTTETLLREIGTSPEVVSVILNHNTSQLRKIYDKSENFFKKRSTLVCDGRYLIRLNSNRDSCLRRVCCPSVAEEVEA
ncbi:integrase family protein [Nostoc sp. CHAB 5824]|nr:integrase family protein [Nostoc sp. CHAB 5824]